MLFSSLFGASKKEINRNRIIAAAAAIESLESRTLLSTVYVSPTGSDAAAGTVSAPFKTIQYALNQAQSGDTVSLRGGAYNLGSQILITKPNITLEGYAGEVAKIVAPTTNASIEVAVRIDVDAHNTTLRNLDISGGYYYTIKTESLVDSGAPSEYGPSHLLITNSKLHDSGRDVVKLTPKTDYSVIEFTEIYNSGRRDGSNAEGIDAVQANYATLRDSYIHDTTTNGIYYKGGSVGTVIERNRVARTAHSGILLGQQTDENWFDTATNPKLYESVDAIVRNNVVWDTEGAGIGSWAALRPQIYNNTMYNVAQSMFGGLLVQGQEHWFLEGGTWVSHIVPSTDVTLYNNIVVVPGARPALEVRDQGLTGFLKSDYNYFQSTGGAATYANYVTGVSGSLATWKASGLDTHSYEGNPGLDTTNLYHLTSSSPAIDKGLTLTNVTSDYDKQARPAGAAYDIGADEFGGVVTTPTDPTPTPTPEPTPTPTPTPSDPVYTAAWTNTAFTSQSGTFTMEFDATPKMANMDMVLGASSGSAGAYSSMATIARFNNTGTIDARNGAGYQALTSVAYEMGKSYHFKFVVNMSTHTYDVYVTPAGATAATKIAGGYAFRTEQASVTSLNNMATYNETGDATVANLKVVDTTVVPAPTPTPTPTPTTGYVNTAVQQQTGKFVAVVYASAGQTDKSVMFGLSQGAADAVADMPMAIRFNSAGSLDVRTGSTWSRSTKFSYKANTSYKFRVEVDMVAKRYSVFVIQNGTAIQIAKNYAFNGSQKSAVSVNNFVKMNANGGSITTSGLDIRATTLAAPSTTTDLARGKTAKSSSNEGADYVASMVNDGDDSTRWASGTIGGTSWVSVDLGASYSLASVKLNWEYASAAQFQVQVSSDGVNWATAGSGVDAPQGGWTTTNVNVAGRYVRVLCTAPASEWGYSIYTMQVFGK